MGLPVNNQDIFDDPETAKDRFFLLADLEIQEDGYYFDIEAAHPCVVQREEDQQAVYMQAGTTLPLRKMWDNPDRRGDYAYISNTRMIGAGGIVSVQVGEDEPRTVLFEKTGGPSKGRMAQPSGLSDESPLHTLWTELIEETGIVTIDREREVLSLVMLTPDVECDPAFSSAAEQAMFLDRLEQVKYTQLDVVRDQLPEDISDWDIVVERRPTTLSPEDEAYMEHVALRMPNGTDVEIDAIVSDSERTANTNILRPTRLNLPEGTEFICVDPEVFRRPVRLFTRDELLTPEFIADKASVPMTPYLQKVRAMEVDAKPSTGSTDDLTDQAPQLDDRSPI